MTYSAPASVNRSLVSLLPLVGPRGAWAVLVQSGRVSLFHR
jgi:hypothetical protein